MHAQNYQMRQGNTHRIIIMQTDILYNTTDLHLKMHVLRFLIARYSNPYSLHLLYI